MRKSAENFVEVYVATLKLIYLWIKTKDVGLYIKNN